MTGISVAHLQRLMSVLGTNMVDLFAEPGQKRRKLILPPERPGLTLNDGTVLIEDLAVGPRQMEIQLWTVQSGAASESAYTHQGEEAMYLLSGRLEVHLSEIESYTLTTERASTSPAPSPPASATPATSPPSSSG